MKPRSGAMVAGALVGVLAGIVCAAALQHQPAPAFWQVRAEFFLFAVMLAGVAVLHESALEMALAGLLATAALRQICDPAFPLAKHLWHEGPLLLNLLGLLLGFAVLARHFARSRVPELLPRWLPDDWKGGFVLLAGVFALSAMLDNIAAALIGGTIAQQVFRGRVHIGFLAAIVAASNAGGTGSVLGDTTTTMLWIGGVAWTAVLPAYFAAVPAFLLFGIAAAIQQQRLQPIQRDPDLVAQLAWRHLAAVVLALAGAAFANAWFGFPAAGVWLMLLIVANFAPLDRRVLPATLRGSFFLLALVTCASLMPVDALPPPSAGNAFGLGLVSAVFDNIPLTKLALDQGGWDWAYVAYAVGFGGSLLWFGSSAGVALAGLFPDARNAGRWLWHGWPVVLAYPAGFAALHFLAGWTPH